MLEAAKVLVFAFLISTAPGRRRSRRMSPYAYRQGDPSPLRASRVQKEEQS
jgi:hypothetical protein